MADRATTGRTGWYRITLPPGRYSVRITQRRFGTGPYPGRVTVRRGRIARVDFEIDTGIR